MRRGARLLLWSAVGLLAAATVLQWASAFGGSGERAAEPAEMLFEASLFQVEILASRAAEAARAETTGDLDGLKQAAYSVEFTHALLRRTKGGDFPELAGVTALLEWIVRLEVGGERRLRSEEAERLAAAAPHFAELYDAYAGIRNGGREGAAALERVKRADGRIREILTAGAR